MAIFIGQANSSKTAVYRIVITQLLASIVVALVFIPTDIVIAYSIFLGGMTCVLPNVYMAWRIGRESANPRTALKYLVRGEMGKLAITAVLFSAVFLWVKPLAVGYFFTALVLVMMCHIVVPLSEHLLRQSRSR